MLVIVGLSLVQLLVQCHLMGTEVLSDLCERGPVLIGACYVHGVFAELSGGGERVGCTSFQQPRGSHPVRVKLFV